MFIKIKQTLVKFANRPEVMQKMDEERVKRDWQEIVRVVNDRAVGKSEAVEIKNKTLVVRVINNLWLQEMFFYRDDLDKKVTKCNKNITSIRFVL